MKFKKWLKEHQFGASDAKDICFAPTKCEHYHGWDICKKLGKCPRENSITVQALGEWAWQCLKDTDEIECYFDQLPSQDNFQINKKSIEEFADKGEWTCIYWEIAIVCLGKKEVFKRIKGDEMNGLQRLQKLPAKRRHRISRNCHKNK